MLANKLKNVHKLQQVLALKRDRQAQMLQQQRQQAQHYQQQLDSLLGLQQHYQQAATQGRLNSALLTNQGALQSMLTKVLNHHRHEQALLQADCDKTQQQLYKAHQQVKGLEGVAARWQSQLQQQRDKQAERITQELINARFKRQC